MWYGMKSTPCHVCACTGRPRGYAGGEGCHLDAAPDLQWMGALIICARKSFVSNCRLRLYCVKAARHTFKEEGKMGTTRVMVVTFKMRHFIPVESEEAKKAQREPSSSAPGRAPGSRLGPRSPLPRSLGPPSAIIIVSREPRAREPEAGLPGSRLPGSRAPGL